jgi:hypothetical protein
MTLPETRTILHEMRGIPYFMLQEYLQEMGGRLVEDNFIRGDGWSVLLEKMEPFRLGSLSVGQTRLKMEINEAIADDFILRFQKKTLRAGG